MNIPSLSVTRNTTGVSLMEKEMKEIKMSPVEVNKEMVVQHHPDEGKFSLLGPRAGYSAGIYDKPLSCFGCGIGWFSFILGFVFPPLWYYATILYFGNYQLKDPRERPGLAASAIAALVCSVAVLIFLLAVFLKHLSCS